MFALEFGKHLFRLNLADQEEKRGTLRRNGFGQTLHEIVVDTVIGHRSGKSAGAGTDCTADDEPSKRIEEKQTNERTPESARKTTACGACRRQIDTLLETNLSGFITNGDDGILQIDQIFFFELNEPVQDSVRFVCIIETKHNKF